MKNALVVGSIALDSIETPHGKVDEVLGGSASYGSISAARFAPTSLVAVVGEDFPAKYRTQLRKGGVDLAGLRAMPGETFRWSGYYEREMANAHTLTTCLNVFESFRPELTAEQASTPFVFLANIHPDLQFSVVEQLRDPALVALDTMNFWIEGSKKELTRVIERSTLLLMNEDEARQYCETTNLVEAGEALRKLGPEAVIIKKGEHGSLIFFDGGMFVTPAYPLHLLKDPTGAGDTFAGSVVGYLARLGKVTPSNLRRAVAVGSVMASFTCEDFSLDGLRRARPEMLAARVKELQEMTKSPAIDATTLTPVEKA